ncbi:MAG: guanylate kinase [Clostridia bacterium]|nr:guanylate kinase [Clostridia bacterium]
MRNLLFVISGPSGVGKGTISKLIVERNENTFLSVSYTTRLPRKGEIDGKDYFFVNREKFDSVVKENGFLEYSEHFGNCYGTPKKEVLDKLGNSDVILEIDVNGGLSVKKNHKDAVLIMILPPSIEVLRQRLEGRNSETEEQRKTRLSRIDYELSKKDEYDYLVVNDDLETAVKTVEDIINKEKNK